MKKVVGPVSGCKVVEGPHEGKRMQVQFDAKEIVLAMGSHGFGRKSTKYPLTDIQASEDGGNLVLVIGQERYVLELKNAAAAAADIEATKATGKTSTARRAEELRSEWEDAKQQRIAADNETDKSDDVNDGIIVKKYRNEREYAQDAQKMAAAGYMPQGQMQHKGKVNIGRTVGKAVVFLPWAIMRPSKKAESVTVTWVKQSDGPIQVQGPQADVMDKLRKLAALRDDGILTEEEYTAKKESLLAQM